MHRSAFPLIVLSAWLGGSGCSPAPDAGDPRAALERYFAAARADDWEGFYQVVSSGYRAGRTAAEFSEWARSATPPFVRAMTERTSHEIGEVHVEGDRATIEVDLQTPNLQAIAGLENRLPSEEEVRAAPLVPARHTFALVREEGQWRVVLEPPAQPDPRLVERLERAAGASNPEERASSSTPDR
jgi:hypothetical protein